MGVWWLRDLYSIRAERPLATRMCCSCELISNGHCDKKSCSGTHVDLKSDMMNPYNRLQYNCTTSKKDIGSVITVPYWNGHRKCGHRHTIYMPSLTEKSFVDGVEVVPTYFCLLLEMNIWLVAKHVINFSAFKFSFGSVLLNAIT